VNQTVVLGLHRIRVPSGGHNEIPAHGAAGKAECGFLRLPASDVAEFGFE